MNRDGLANFFLGLGVGVGVGLLFAPKSGEETRAALCGGIDEGREFLRNRTADLRENAEDLVARGLEALDRQRDTLNDAIAAGKQAYRDKVEETPGQPA